VGTRNKVKVQSEGALVGDDRVDRITERRAESDGAFSVSRKTERDERKQSKITRKSPSVLEFEHAKKGLVQAP